MIAAINAMDIVFDTSVLCFDLLPKNATNAPNIMSIAHDISGMNRRPITNITTMTGVITAFCANTTAAGIIINAVMKSISK